MKILSITLVGYLHFRLRQIKHFHYRPNQKTQIVLGTNGSGKSSLLRELSPLPASQTDFDKGGRKEIEIDHNGHLYLLQSLFTTDGNRFVFMMDGENLNPGYTVTVYRELVKAHFGYTPEIHALLTGSTTFHSMSVNERRNWFTRISEVDYTYAIKYHQRLRERIRDIKGALNRTSQRLTQEAEKCLTPKDEAALRTVVAELNTSLDTLLSHRKPRLADRSRRLAEVEQVETALRHDMARLERVLNETPTLVALNDMDGLERQQTALQTDVVYHQRDIVRRCEVVEGLEKELAAAAATSQTSLAEVQGVLQDLDEELTTLYSYLRLKLHFEDVLAAASAFDGVKETLADIFNDLRDCPRLTYTREAYQGHLQAVTPLRQSVLKQTDALAALVAEIKAHEAAKAKGVQECPKCQHQWYPGYDAIKCTQLTAQLVQDKERLVLAEKAELENTATIQEHQVFFDILNRYHRLTDSLPVLQPFWDYIQYTKKMLTDPGYLTGTLENLSVDFKYQRRIHAVSLLVAEKQKLETLLKNTQQVDVAKVQQRLTTENAALLVAQNQLRVTQKALDDVKAILATRTLMDKLDASITQNHHARRQQYLTLVEDQCMAVLDELIRNIKLTVSGHERTLSQIDIQKGVVQSLGQQIKDLSREMELLKKAEKALSPTEGLIARGMTAFINHFVGRVNAFIADIWTYPLKLVPILVNDDEAIDLDYKFSVQINDDHTTPDISKTSTGMQEIIDLAFVAVSMQYLGLQNSPIFLDEFAASFDVAHRQAAYHAIEHLIDSTDYSQVFLVSHYQNGYSSLNAAEVLVLCSSNVELPPHLAYNQHVTMTS